MGERQRAVKPDEMATTSTAVATVSPQTQEESVERVAVITLRPASGTACAPRRRVAWAEDTVDNEHMNKKKSKCCCIYEKPRRFDESDSEDSEDECEHCFGHVEKRGHKHDTCSTVQENTAEEPPASVSLQPSAPAPPDKTGPSS